MEVKMSTEIQFKWKPKPKGKKEIYNKNIEMKSLIPEVDSYIEAKKCFRENKYDKSVDYFEKTTPKLLSVFWLYILYDSPKYGLHNPIRSEEYYKLLMGELRVVKEENIKKISDGLLILGFLYQHGIGVMENHKKAKHYYQDYVGAIKNDNALKFLSYQFLGEIYWFENQYKEAQDFYTKAIELNAEFVPALLGFAQCQRHTQLITGMDQAKDYLKKITDQKPSYHEVWYEWGLLCCSNGDYVNGSENFARALKLAGANETYEAEQIKALKVVIPKDHKAAKAYLKEYKYGQAIEYFNMDYYYASDFWLYILSEYDYVRDPIEAKKYKDKFLSGTTILLDDMKTIKNPKIPDDNLILAYLYQKGIKTTQNFKLAKDYYEKYKMRAEKFGEEIGFFFYQLRAECHDAEGNQLQAYQDFNQAIQLNPDFLFAKRGFAYTQRFMKEVNQSEVERSLEYFILITQKYSESFEAWFEWGMWYVWKKEHIEASQKFNKARLIDPENDLLKTANKVLSELKTAQVMEEFKRQAAQTREEIKLLATRSPKETKSSNKGSIMDEKDWITPESAKLVVACKITGNILDWSKNTVVFLEGIDPNDKEWSLRKFYVKKSIVANSNTGTLLIEYTNNQKQGTSWLKGYHREYGCDLSKIKLVNLNSFLFGIIQGPDFRYDQYCCESFSYRFWRIIPFNHLKWWKDHLEIATKIKGLPLDDHNVPHTLDEVIHNNSETPLQTSDANSSTFS